MDIKCDTDKFSEEARLVIYEAIRQLSTLRYGYRQTVEGCVDTLIDYTQIVPKDSINDEMRINIVDRIIEVMADIYSKN